MKKVKISNDIYSNNSITNALKAYNHIALITVRKNKDHTLLTFWKCKYNEEQTIREFENYLIGLENS